MPRYALLTFALFLVQAPLSRAQDDVFLRGKEKPQKVTIKTESGLGIDPGKGNLIPAEEIVDILYTPSSITVMASVYRPAFNLEKDYFDPDPKKDPKTRKGSLPKVIKGYADAYAQVSEKQIKRHLEYKLAVLSLRQAQEEGEDLEGPAQKLMNYKTKHYDSWQIASCLRLLAGLQVARGKLKEAEEAYLELAAANVAPEVKLEGELLAAQVGVRAGKVKEAFKKIDDILSKLPKESKLWAKARIAKAESLAAAKDKDQAIGLLRQIIKESADKSIKAQAYNALGEIYFQAAAYKEARWEFLYVDVVYNQDKNEHAKALYYLSQVFDKLGDADKAKECRDILAADRNFAGMEWQRLAVQAAKTP